MICRLRGVFFFYACFHDLFNHIDALVSNLESRVNMLFYRPFLVSNRQLLYMLNIDIVWHYFFLQYLQILLTKTSRFETDIADGFLRLPVIKWSEPVTLKSRICILLLPIFTLVCKLAFNLLIDSTLKANKKNNSIQICFSVHRKAFGIYLLALNLTRFI